MLSGNGIGIGQSTFETMKFMHTNKVIDQLHEANCRIENNIFHDYVMKVTERVGAPLCGG
ncbi:MAG: hypothetical protein ABR512_05565 [Desulfopila sp.]